MNRRQALKTTFSAAVGGSIFRTQRLAGQRAGTAAEGNTVYLNPATGADTNSGAKDRPLRTLAEAARQMAC